MTRVARMVAPGFPHHVTQRGNRKLDIFANDDDRRFYLATVNKYAQKHGVAIWAYCLMSNHVHFIAVPASEQALGRTMHDAHGVYSMRFNEINNLSGHLFQGRFYSTILDEEHLWAAVRYVERNPVRAGIVSRAESYKWSSARAHCSGPVDPLLAAGFPPRSVVDDWSRWLRDVNDPLEQGLRMATRTGRPCGSAEFVKRIESILDRAIEPKKPGRKSKLDNSGVRP